MSLRGAESGLQRSRLGWCEKMRIGDRDAALVSCSGITGCYGKEAIAIDIEHHIDLWNPSFG